jgi:hypothetical protein
MPGKAGTLEVLAQQVGLALQPLQSQLTSDGVIPFLAQLGLQFPPQLLQPSFVNSLKTAATAASALPTTLSQLATDIASDNELGIVNDGLKLIQEIGSLLSTLPQIGVELKNIAGTIPGMNSAEVTTFAENLATNILSYSLISYLEGNQPGVVAILNLLGIMSYAPNAGVGGNATHPPFIARKLQLSNLGNALKSPGNMLQTLFQWGLPGFDGTVLIPALSASFDLLGFYSTVTSSAAPAAMSSGVLDIQANAATNPPGLLATLKDDLPAGFNLTLPLSALWSVTMQVNGTFSAGLTATAVPPSNLNLKPPSVTLTGLLEMDLTAKAPDADHPVILIGQTGASNLQASSILFGAGLTATWDISVGSAVAESLIRFEVTGGKAVIDTTQGDGFLATVLSGVHVEAGFDFKITWQLDTGIHFEGGAQLELDLPLHLDLGPVKIPILYLVAGASTSGIPLELSVALGVTLGPISATVDRVGMRGLLSFPDSGGNLGAADLSISFKPPNGLGISIDAGVLAGGGYLSFDRDKGQYAGVLDAALLDVVQIKIIGVLDTKLPDGTPGYAFLLIITFDFPPIQLSFGFTLTGVGGLVGVNRTMSKDGLHAGFRAHTLNSVMFPPNPVANAPQIISDLRSFFPPAERRYIFGPMLQLGWGTPTLITLSLGVIMEVPDPVQILILGLIDAGLPTADAPLIEMHIDVLGLVDFEAKTLSIDGVLYDSRVLIYSMTGSLALRLFWGDNPNFVFSLGGFNPHFDTAGLDIPAMQRCAVSIGNGDNPRLSANNYLAITSNSVQFGANVEAYAAAGGFAIHGYIGFDTIIVISPFSFEYDFSAGFDVSYEGHTLLGLNVHGTVSGPRPWHLHGDAEIDIFVFSVSASVDLTWGDSTPVTLPQRPVLDDLLPALQDPRNWSAALPDGTTQTVSFVAPTPDASTLLVHPMGTLSVREKVVPLDLAITRYGDATPSDGNYFSISKVEINGQTESEQTFSDYFAAGQFLTLSDADKVSRPSFELYDAGLKIGSAAVVAGANAPRNVVYDERYIDDPKSFSRLTGRYSMPAAIHRALVQQGAGYMSPLKNTGMAKYRGVAAEPAVTIHDTSYVVAGVDDLAIRSNILTAEGATYFQARASLNAYLAIHPEEAVNLQILPAHEAAQ